MSAVKALFDKADESFMQMALDEAEKASRAGEVPIGAVVAAQGVVIARAHNLTEQLNDVTAHAEMQAITSAANHLGGKYLDQCTLYVSLEPCPMCAGALRWAQLGRLVYATEDTKNGYSRVSSDMLHPKTKTDHGLLADKSATLLRNFFSSIRNNKV